MIFGDATLIQMSRDKPRTEDDMLEINGVGQVKLERYGAEFLDVIGTF